MQNERKRILNLVEKGTITATEALILLEALEKEPARASQQTDSTSIHTDKQSTSASTSHGESTTSYSSSSSSSTESSNTNRSKKKEFPFNFDEFFQQGKSTSEKQNKQGTNPTDRIMDFVQNAFEKVKGLDLEFNMGPSLEFTHTFESHDNDILDIEISVANGKVEIRPWDENYVKADCDVKVYRSDNQEKALAQLVENVIFNVQNKKLRYVSDLKMMKIDTVIYVPKLSYNRWDIRLFNGKFHGESANVNKVKVKTANGKIELANMLIEKGELETANGGIDVSNTRADSIEAESVNGKVAVEGAIDEMEVQSINGNVICKTSSTSARKMEAKTLAGSITLYVPESIPLDGVLKSNFGRFDINHREMDHIEEREEIMQRKLRFTRERPEGTKLYLFADAKTGVVSVKPQAAAKEQSSQENAQSTDPEE
ncbi:DUF4097 family beta strand repeat-containing protein [Jeotgalibacillus soli]|uniref:Uncharacterized protein n=1 Tax=Jeotgalibacillus soli TaxID=889306 RepID=A0A0C2RII8_9BACL|nr:DUF4097 family beta strand repeat-containing protein [Jeotgalibacillus soli]KIL49970.1 hypothetical protein KP78_14380 [Jeotgalibacillus soli]